MSGCPAEQATVVMTARVSRVCRKRLRFRAGVGMAVVLVMSLPARGREAVSGNWDQFRGHDGQGVAERGGIPTDFGPDRNVLWRTALPPGKSSPVIWNGRVFLTAYTPADRKTLMTLGIDRRSGKVLWRQALRARSTARLHPMNSPATPTPAVDGKHVYVYFGTYGLVCYDHGGRKIWDRPLDAPKSQYGVATSPILYKDTLILVLDDNGGASRVLAVSRSTGRTVWEQPRPLFRAGWSTPMIWRHEGGEELAVLGYKRLTSYNPSNGQELWWVGGFSVETVGVPVAGEGLLFAGAAALAGFGDKKRDLALTWKLTVEQFDANRDNRIQRGEMTKGFTIPLRPELDKDNPGYGLPMRDMDGLMRFFDKDKDRAIAEREWMQAMAGFAAESQPRIVAIRPGAKGNARPSHVAWEIQRGVPETPSMLYFGGRLYLLRDGGVLTCLKATTGKELFSERIGAPGGYIASPIAAGDRIVVASVRGVVTVIQADDKLKVLGRSDLKERIYATPAIAGNAIYLRTGVRLYAIGQATQQAAAAAR